MNYGHQMFGKVGTFVWTAVEGMVVWEWWI